MSNSPEFINAANVIINLLSKPSTDELSDLYGLYKMATIGDNMTEKPSFINYTANQKWQIWSSFNGLTKRQAEIKYITLVNTLIQKYGLKK